jgi:hypothetical protein
LEKAQDASNEKEKAESESLTQVLDSKELGARAGARIVITPYRIKTYENLAILKDSSSPLAFADNIW